MKDIKNEKGTNDIKAILAALAMDQLADNTEGKKENSVDYAEIVKNAVVEEIENIPARSAWSKGVRGFAIDLFARTAEGKNEIEILNITKNDLLNGADDWNQFSYGGCRLVNDGEIAESLCTPSELKRKKGGELPPNSYETWLDVQARALRQASWEVLRAITHIR